MSEIQVTGADSVAEECIIVLRAKPKQVNHGDNLKLSSVTQQVRISDRHGDRVQCSAAVSVAVSCRVRTMLTLISYIMATCHCIRLVFVKKKIENTDDCSAQERKPKHTLVGANLRGR